MRLWALVTSALSRTHSSVGPGKLQGRPEPALESLLSAEAHGVWRLAMALCLARRLVMGVIRLQGLSAKGTWVPAGPGCPKPA